MASTLKGRKRLGSKAVVVLVERSIKATQIENIIEIMSMSKVTICFCNLVNRLSFSRRNIREVLLLRWSVVVFYSRS